MCLQSLEGLQIIGIAIVALVYIDAPREKSVGCTLKKMNIAWHYDVIMTIMPVAFAAKEELFVGSYAPSWYWPER